MTEIERLTAENDRLTGELARPKHETLRQLADVVERYDHMKLRAEAAEAQAAADREGTKRYADKWRAAEARVRELEGALRELVWIIDKAGLLNLSNGVQLGQTSWYVKAYDRLEAARAALAAALREAAAGEREKLADAWRSIHEHGFPHWCRDGHERIGFESDDEVCPVCKREARVAELERKLAEETERREAAELDFEREHTRCEKAEAERLRQDRDAWIERHKQEQQDANEIAAENERLRQRVAELYQMLEEARDIGAKMMIDQMERAVTGGGRFSDERANRFVDAVKRQIEPEEPR